MNKLHKITSNALAHNLMNAMRVAGIGLNENEEVKNLTQEQIHENCGIARSTISRLTRINNKGDGSNPDLKTICKLAEVLNVPPALLLMSPKDIKRLIGSLDAFKSITEMASKSIDSDLNEILSTKEVGKKASLTLKLANRISPIKALSIEREELSTEELNLLINRRKQANIVGNYIVGNVFKDEDHKSRKKAILIISTLSRNLDEDY